MDADLLRADLAALYPQYGLRVAHQGTVLLAPTDEELLELADIVAEPGGIVAPGRVGELLGWPEDEGAAAARRFLEWAWRLREAPTPARWRAPMAVLDGGRVLGLATLAHELDDPAGTARTASWLARAEQGRGLGRRVRLMLLELAFGPLGMTRAVTAAAEGNEASRAVSAACGYRETHRATGSDGVLEVHAAVTVAAWRKKRLRDVDVEGVDALLAAIRS
ncbi:RimJ/RimL family protein N-acetyltransferase [Actinomycetospora succinea]|uniref:RimJ/RimL family protein N-acetyltransferase n=1 Tax=Actinomycetospora succinea TaxID=663603 RepID=A0A4R6VY88_9PSEU|nr:GNAT family protein [Actinomycetospora succinea]TDQ65545.1 RimJ/RimL family protein N-acetyltransferase [Actinomycetospora succinea]